LLSPLLLLRLLVFIRHCGKAVSGQTQSLTHRAHSVSLLKRATEIKADREPRCAE